MEELRTSIANIPGIKRLALLPQQLIPTRDNLYPAWSRLRRVLYRFRWMTNPVVVFVFLQVVWLAILLLWVYWFVDQSTVVDSPVDAISGVTHVTGAARSFLVPGMVLLGLLLTGTVMLFVFAINQRRLARHQRAFLSSVTHELRSPLASLQLGIETLCMRDFEREMRVQLLDMLKEDTERLSRLVDQILVSSRLDRGIMMFEEISDVELLRFLNECCLKASHLDERLAARLTVECPSDLVVRTCTSALTLVIGNLVENAVKYSPKGSPIRIRAKFEHGDLRIEVQDQGLGLDKRDRKRVFGMFYRARVAGKRAIPGTGLGLYIVKSTVKVLGGRVWAESSGRGRGSTFHVELPVKRMGEGGANG